MNAIQHQAARRGENFPVASYLLPAHARMPVLAFYDFARGADDIADAPNVSAGDRRSGLLRMLSALKERTYQELPPWAVAYGEFTKQGVIAPQFGIDFMPRGAPEGVRVTRTPDWQADLYELLRAYTTQRIASVDRNYHLDPPKVYSIEMARLRLERILGSIPEWTELAALAPMKEVDAPGTSVIASAFNAALEFAKDGRIDLRQLGAFEPIFVRARQQADERKDS